MNNPANMSNEDLERDMDARNEADLAKKTSTDQDSADLTDDNDVPEEKTMDMGIEFEVDKEQDLDDLIHEQGKLKGTGTLPDPEEIKFRESQ